MDPPCSPPICSHEQFDLCWSPRYRNYRGVSGPFSWPQWLTNAYRYTSGDIALHEKVLKLVLMFKTTLKAFSSDPKLLDSFIAHVSAYMHPSVWFYSGEITSACKFSQRSKTRRFGVPQKHHIAVLAPRIHCRGAPTPSFGITQKERSGVQSPLNSVLFVSSWFDGGLCGWFGVSNS